MLTKRKRTNIIDKFLPQKIRRTFNNEIRVDVDLPANMIHSRIEIFTNSFILANQKQFINKRKEVRNKFPRILRSNGQEANIARNQSFNPPHPTPSTFTPLNCFKTFYETFYS